MDYCFDTLMMIRTKNNNTNSAAAATVVVSLQLSLLLFLLAVVVEAGGAGAGASASEPSVLLVSAVGAPTSTTASSSTRYSNYNGIDVGGGGEKEDVKVLKKSTALYSNKKSTTDNNQRRKSQQRQVPPAFLERHLQKKKCKKKCHVKNNQCISVCVKKLRCKSKCQKKKGPNNKKKQCIEVCKRKKKTKTKTKTNNNNLQALFDKLTDEINAMYNKIKRTNKKLNTSIEDKLKQLRQLITEMQEQSSSRRRNLAKTTTEEEDELYEELLEKIEGYNIRLLLLESSNKEWVFACDRSTWDSRVADLANCMTGNPNTPIECCTGCMENQYFRFDGGCSNTTAACSDECSKDVGAGSGNCLSKQEAFMDCFVEYKNAC